MVSFLSVYAYPSMDKTQTYVSKSGNLNLLFAQQINDSVGAMESDSVKLKDPNMAVLYAIVPGIVVHGAGHFYAGKPKTGFLLLGGELIGTTLIVTGAVTNWGASSPTAEGFVLGIIGGTLFLGSWIYDIIGAPLAVQKQNQNFLGKRSANLKFEFDHKHDSMKIVLIRQF